MMDIITQALSIKTVFFQVLGYEMSYLEFAGTILNLLCVWLATRNSVWSWPIGNLAVVLFAVLFYQIQLYSDFVEQFYFLITGFYGWWCWSQKRNETSGTKALGIGRNAIQENIICVTLILAGIFALSIAAMNLPTYLPTLFPAPASFPVLDAFTTAMSFAANLLMARRRLECWFLWIAVDVIGIGLYFEKDVIFVSLLYAVFLILAIRGLLGWKRILQDKGVSH